MGDLSGLGFPSNHLSKITLLVCSRNIRVNSGYHASSKKDFGDENHTVGTVNKRGLAVEWFFFKDGENILHFLEWRVTTCHFFGQLEFENLECSGTHTRYAFRRLEWEFGLL